MSIAELKSTADRLTARERKWLHAYLVAKDRTASPTWKVEMTRRLKRLRAGHAVSADDYYRRTRTLDRIGPRKHKAT